MSYLLKLIYEKRYEGLSDEKFDELAEKNYHSKTDEEKKAIDDKYHMWQTNSYGQIGKYAKDKEIEKEKKFDDMLKSAENEYLAEKNKDKESPFYIFRLIFWPHKKFSASMFWLLGLLIFGGIPFYGAAEVSFEMIFWCIVLVLGCRYYAWTISEDDID
tara:strand:+ start:230 stop:706 length:477 start_codon:yes stop_codon:yes gene_type:complete